MKCDWCGEKTVIFRIEWKAENASSDFSFCQISGLICPECIQEKLPEEAKKFIKAKTKERYEKTFKLIL